MTPTPRRSNTQSAGHAGESLACRHLESNGFTLVARNVRSPYGEIDLIMRDGETLVFVEVRQRANARFGTPAETVGTRKQQRLRATAEHYLQQHPQQSQKPCRFDIVAIIDDSPAPRIEWLRDAF